MQALFKSKLIAFLVFLLALLPVVYLLFRVDGSSSTLEWIFDKPSFLQQPTVTHDPASVVPLAVLIKFEADAPVIANYSISDGVDTWGYTNNEYLASHRQALLRFRAGKKHEISVTITDKAGHSRVSSVRLIFQAPGLSTNNTSPDLTVTAATSTGLPGMGITIASLFIYDKNAGPSADAVTATNSANSLLVALDEKQEIVWFYKVDYRVDKIEQLSPESLVLISHKGRETIDFFGNRLDFWQGERQRMLYHQLTGGVTVDADNLHSKQVLLANGNHLMLETTMRVMADYPADVVNDQRPEKLINLESSPFSESKITPSNVAAKSMVVGDSVLEVSPAGDVLQRWNLFDLLDIQRATYHGSLPADPILYPPSPTNGLAKSWTRANALAFDQQENTILVSLMNQDAIIGIDKSTGTLKWILGDPSGWQQPWSEKLLKPVGESFSWFYYPSSLRLTSSGDIMLLDNGSYRAIPPVKANSLQQSKPQVKVLAIDEKAMTVMQKSSSALPLQQHEDDFLNWQALQNLTLVDLPDNNHLITADGLDGTLSAIHLANDTAEKFLAFTTDSVSNKKWGIADFIVTNELAAVSDFPLSVTPMEGPLLADAGNNQAPEVQNNNRVNANVSLPTHTVEGSWKLQLGNNINSAKQLLTLQQDERLVTGDLVGYPVSAFIKGNTFSMTVRRDNGDGRVRFRYFGVVNDSFDRMQGAVSIDQDGIDMAQFDWFAYRE